MKWTSSQQATRFSGTIYNLLKTLVFAFVSDLSSPRCAILYGIILTVTIIVALLLYCPCYRFCQCISPLTIRLHLLLKLEAPGVLGGTHTESIVRAPLLIAPRPTCR